MKISFYKLLLFCEIVSSRSVTSAMALLLIFLAFQVSVHLSVCQTKFCEMSCPFNEVFSRNVSQCHNTCYNQNFNQTAKCPTAGGCVCSKGYIRHQESYKCVPFKYCDVKKNPTTCAINEVYSECNAACQKTCKTRNQVFKCDCVSGCVCKSGFIRSDVNFQCIPEKLCSSCPVGYTFSQLSKTCVLNCHACQRNETYSGCGTHCETTCANPTNAAVSCIQGCKEGCFCRKGYVRDINGFCVRLIDCPKSCPENETYLCGNPLCERNCQTIGQACTKYPLRCESKCYCNSGYIRALEGGQCVSRNQCPIINRSFPNVPESK